MLLTRTSPSYSSTLSQVTAPDGTNLGSFYLQDWMRVGTSNMLFPRVAPKTASAEFEVRDTAMLTLCLGWGWQFP